MMYGREEGAETLIEQMMRDQDPILRYGGMYAIGLAYRYAPGGCFHACVDLTGKNID